MKTAFLLLGLFGSLVACSEARLAYHNADEASKSVGDFGSTSHDKDAEGLDMELDPYESERSRELATGNCTLCPAGERPHNFMVDACCEQQESDLQSCVPEWKSKGNSTTMRELSNDWGRCLLVSERTSSAAQHVHTL